MLFVIDHLRSVKIYLAEKHYDKEAYNESVSLCLYPYIHKCIFLSVWQQQYAHGGYDSNCSAYV